MSLHTPLWHTIVDLNVSSTLKNQGNAKDWLYTSSSCWYVSRDTIFNTLILLYGCETIFLWLMFYGKMVYSFLENEKIYHGFLDATILLIVLHFPSWDLWTKLEDNVFDEMLK